MIRFRVFFSLYNTYTISKEIFRIGQIDTKYNKVNEMNEMEWNQLKEHCKAWIIFRYVFQLFSQHNLLDPLIENESKMNHSFWPIRFLAFE